MEENNDKNDAQQSTEHENSETLNPTHAEPEIEKARKLIEEMKQQFEEENKKLNEMKQQIYKEKDFKVSKFTAFDGPNYYSDRKTFVFNVFIAPSGDSVEFFSDEIAKVFPEFAENSKKYVIDLFADVLLHILKMDINLFINKYEISYDEDEYVIAIEYLDKNVTEDCIYLVSDWFYAISNNEPFDLMGEWLKIQAEFDKTFYGGPTLYSLIEGGLKRDIPVLYLLEENQFQWGYGCKQLRGRSTTFNTDGIKDTEFTMFKDMVGEFLDMCGFPTPQTINTFDVEDAVQAASVIGYPCVVKPVAGHKGQGVTTGIGDEQGVRDAFANILKIYEENEIQFDGALVQTQIFGTDHRLLAVDGMFAAALERVPAFVEGDGKHTINELIEIENSKIIRLDNARSPLCKIKIDDDLKDYLKLQELDLQTVPADGENITLRRVANISAGGVSFNVSHKIHPDNIQMVEDIAAYLNVMCLGIDVLAKDISVSWKEGNFGIIEINAGPGVFMHLAPAYGGSIDIPEKILLSHFETPIHSRIPIIAANKVSKSLAEQLYQRIHELKPDVFFAYLLDEGVFFNGRFFHKNQSHTQNEKIILRHPKTDFALFVHDKDNIYDYGLLHRGADIVILDNAAFAEESVLIRQLLKDCPLIEVTDNKVDLLNNDQVIKSQQFDSEEQKDEIILSFIDKYLPDLLKKYL
jgi:cyanophycin synthetase